MSLFTLQATSSHERSWLPEHMNLWRTVPRSTAGIGIEVSPHHSSIPISHGTDAGRLHGIIKVDRRHAVQFNGEDSRRAALPIRWLTLQMGCASAVPTAKGDLHGAVAPVFAED